VWLVVCSLILGSIVSDLGVSSVVVMVWVCGVGLVVRLVVDFL
jgi:hypothetical protein